jgi:hypothetical protein
LYQAKSWNQARRVVAKVEWHSGELFPRVGFIVTNLTRPAKRVVRRTGGVDGLLLAALGQHARRKRPVERTGHGNDCRMKDVEVKTVKL